MTLLDVQHVQKVYQTRFGAAEVTALKDINFSVEEGEYVAVMGESGSGKTTLLNILATLDRPTDGTVLLNGEDIQKISDKVLTEFRRDHLGFVFQDFNLLETLSVYDNMVLPLVLARRPIDEMEKKVQPIAEMLGIEDLLKKYPYELSGGQQQRVAIGRAMITDPSLLLADEPTGALDSKSASNTLDLFDKINQNGQTILMVTHSTVAASRAKRVLFIKDGLIYNQLYREGRTDQQMFELISETLTAMANRVRNMFNLLRSMAITNLRKNRALYVPFALATVMVTVVLYVTNALAATPEFAHLEGGSAMAKTLGFGFVIVQIVSLVVVLYANAFVMKNRAKEFGLYGILGLDRKNIQLLSLIELVVFAALSIGLGLILGVIFHAASFAILLKLIQYDIGIKYSFQFGSIIAVLLTMVAIFVLVFFLNAAKIYMSRPLELLKEKKKGEKKGRAVTVRAIIGLGLLGYAYYMSQSIESPVKALLYFFLAVLLVVIATYILFDAGSIALLSILQKNKKLFYQPTNFISISNLQFRMRKNAAGLASVCILSTMVLVTMATTVALQRGTTATLDRNFPTDYSAVAFFIVENEAEQYPPIVQKIKEQTKGQIKDEKAFLNVLRFGQRTENGFDFANVNAGDNPAAMFTIVSVDQYNKMFGTNYTVGDKEMIVGHIKGDVKKISEVKTYSVVYNATITVKEMIDGTPYAKVMPQLPYVTDNQYVGIVKDPMQFMNPAAGQAMYYFTWNTNTPFELRDAEWAGYKNVMSHYKTDKLVLHSKHEEAKTLYAFMGSLLLVGALLSIAFFIGAVLVIYYKQISEGYEDRDRFVILQKLGIDQKTIKKSINRQVLIVFFLPLVTAFIHTAFAFKMYRKIIELFGVDGSVTLNATVVIGAIFVVVYLIVYQITSRSYYRIIKR